MKDNGVAIGPIAVGGVGGSGTRVVATFLKNLGFYIGSDLNAANDNRWFTLLMARPKWYAESSKQEIADALSIFERAMTGSLRVTRSELNILIRAAIGLSFCEYLHWAQTPAKRAIKKVPPLRWGLTMAWSLQRIRSIARSGSPDRTRYIGWAWKEPCTYAYLEQLAECFPGIKYVHVMRHGLDMAYSDNQGHLLAWGDVIGVDQAHSRETLPSASLNFWIAANEKVLAQGKQLFGERFMAINFDRLCSEPHQQTRALVDFLGVSATPEIIARLGAMCRVPTTVGRYREYDTPFTFESIQAVRRLGFPVDEAKY